VLGALAIVVVVVAGVVMASGGKDGDRSAGGRIEGSPEIFLEPVANPGPDGFTTSVDTDPTATATTTTASGPAQTAPSGPPEATAVRGLSGSQPGLYGGTRNNSSCNRAQLVSFLQATPDKAAAWAAVQGITAAQIPAFVDGLTPVRLLVDARVTNHGFANGRATPRQSVLQAGTAVLVDDRGEPRVRCACGNPLRAPMAAPTAPQYVGTPWPGFTPARTAVLAPAPQPVGIFVLQDPGTGQSFARPSGTDGRADGAVPPSTTTTTGLAGHDHHVAAAHDHHAVHEGDHVDEPDGEHDHDVIDDHHGAATRRRRHHRRILERQLG
jgi:hypothetical protein